MGKYIRFTDTLLITMDSMGARLTSQLPYDNNMLYLPLPETSEYMAASDALDDNTIVIAPVKEKGSPPGHMNE